MATVDVVTGQDVLASQYNLLRAEVIANASAAYNAAAAASAAAADLDTHEAATAQVHGLPAGIDVLGAASPGLYIQYAKGALTWSHTGGQWEEHYAYAAWPVGFTNLYAVASSVGVGSVTVNSAFIGQMQNVRYSTVGATARANIYNVQGENTSMQLDIIGIGN